MKTYRYQILSILLVVFVLFGSSCRTDFFGSSEVPEVKTSAPIARPERVVVDGIRTSYADIVGKASPAVVRITALVRNRAPQQRIPTSPFDELFKENPRREPKQGPARGFGSGVLVSADGTILTNHHVVADAEKITVEMEDNKSFEAKVIGTDPPSDLAVLKIEGENLEYLELGDSDEVLVGDIVLAIGNPLGIGQTVTSGIISAKGRRTGSVAGGFEDFLQTDAAINRGNSGGALVNLKGELIGINSQILSPTGGSIGIGFSIPSNMCKSIMEQLVKNGKVRRGLLGINIQDLTSELADSLNLKTARGVVVSNVRKDSAAEKAGIKRNDVIISIDGEKVENGNNLRNKVAGIQPGTKIEIEIIRAGEKMEIEATLDEGDSAPLQNRGNDSKNKESEPIDEEKHGDLGFKLQPLTPEIRKQLKIDGDIKGVVIASVDRNGPASEKGIRSGDLILEVNQKSVESQQEFADALSASGDRTVLLLISRGGQTLFVTITPKKE